MRRVSSSRNFATFIHNPFGTGFKSIRMVISRYEISEENESRIKRGGRDILFSIGSFQTFFPFVPTSWRLREYRKPAGPLPKCHHPPLPSILLFPDWYFHSHGFGFFPAVSRWRRKLWKFIASTDFFFYRELCPSPPRRLADASRYDTELEARLIKRSLSFFSFFRLISLIADNRWLAS